MTQHSAAGEVLAPKSHKLEFGGLWGALFISTTVPLTIYYFTFACDDNIGCALSLPVTNTDAFFANAKRQFIESFTDTTAWCLYFGWYVYCVLAWLVLPGKWLEGLALRTGNRLQYKINGMIALGSVSLYVAVYGPAAFTFAYDHWPGLVTAALVNAFVQACYVYFASFCGNKLLALGGNSGNVLFDWFIGRELNPRVGSFDIKTFNELRPGLILWVIMDISCVCKQYTLYGHVSYGILLVLFFHTWYVVDSLAHEPTILSQMDITTDGFGFMLSVGDLAWVPFTYSLQARYLAFTPVHLGVFGVLAILTLQVTGFYIFRTANVEKNDFRSGRNPKSPYATQC
ncbi:Erg24p [Malassezia vespertilionis]|uniref:Erg24p n=1 Tax=Malassezia vespertilionis TaxID=2020962 RepID=A0A2N1JDN7_9BASI|nr:Erg24p [Malassezia vespertilionis]